MIRSYRLSSGSTSGGAGASGATATTTTEIIGRVLAVGVIYNGSPPASTDVTVATVAAVGSPAITLVGLTNANSDVWVYPAAALTTSAAAAVTYDATNEIYVGQPIAGEVSLTVAQANDDDSVDICLVVDEG